MSLIWLSLTLLLRHITHSTSKCADDTLPLTSRDCKVLQNLQLRFAKLRERWGASLLEPWEKAAAMMLEGGVKHELDALDELSGYVDMCFKCWRHLFQPEAHGQ